MIKICGIYKITSPSGKIYIGQSIDIPRRWKEHKKLSCKHQRRLIASLKKYSPDNHIFEILHKCPQEDLNKWEKYYVDLYNTFNSRHGLNLKDGGLHCKMSDETKARLSKSKMGYIHSPESRENMRLSQLGRVFTEEVRKKISESNKGKFFSEERRRNMSEAQKRNPRRYWLGKKLPKEACDKMSKSHKGLKRSDETKRKIGLFNKGKKISMETKMKMSISAKERWNNKRKEQESI